MSRTHLSSPIFPALSFAAVLIGALTVGGTALGREDDRPNILIIVSDDQGSADMGFQGSRIRTPNIDRLANEGAVLRNFYVQPWCVPTRASLMTGAPPGTWAFGSPLDSGLPADTPTVAHRFRDAGYQTALIGKWHLGGRPESHPNAAGFEHFYGLLGGFVDYLTHRIGGQLDWQRNGAPVEEEGYATTLLADETIEYIERRDPTRPFFLVLAFNAPHGSGNMATPEMVARSCKGPTGPYVCRYLAAVEQMDMELGRVLWALEDEEIDEETLVVFFTDNGGWPAFGSYNTPPLRGRKFQVLEGAIRVGALVRWPEEIEPRVIRQRIHVQDLWATLEAAAGLAREAPAESVDHWRTLAGKRHGLGPKQSLFFTNRPHPCLRCCCFLPFIPFFPRDSALIRGRWKLILNERVVWRPFIGEAVLPNPGVALYDLRFDPGERFDLSEKMPDKADAMLAELREWEAR